jgi:hypothetical protein
LSTLDRNNGSIADNDAFAIITGQPVALWYAKMCETLNGSSLVIGLMILVMQRPLLADS